MKLIRGNGKFLEVYEISDGPIYRIEAGSAPIKCHGWLILDDEEARNLLRSIMATGLYHKAA